MAFAVIEIKGKKELRDFINLPWKIYRDNKNWVPPLKQSEWKLLSRDIHPFHKHSEVAYFLAKDGKETLGRICSIVNYVHNEFHNEKAGFFGFFECVQDNNVARLLFENAETWLRNHDMKFSQGPCNFSTNETCGLLVEGFEKSPVVMMPYNPPYYIDLITNNGYKQTMNLLAYYLSKDTVSFNRLKKLCSLISQRYEKSHNLVIREINIKNFDDELKVVKEVYNNAWSKNWGFVPMTDEEFLFAAKELKQIVLPEFTCIAEINGEPVGFALAIPDINQILKKINGNLFPFGFLHFMFGLRKIKTMRVIALGVVHKYQNLGIGTLFYLRFLEEGIKRGYNGELSWVLETNELMNKPLREMGAVPYKRYCIYRKDF